MRADGGPEIGYGHLVRVSALTKELIDRGLQVVLATATPVHANEVVPSDVEIVPLPSRTDSAPLLDVLGAGVEIAVIDSYVADERYQRAVREEVTLVMVSDDTRHPICADVLVNGNIYAPDLKYQFLGQEPELYLGPDHLMVRDAITRLVDQDPPWRDPPNRLIITMGGSDIAEMTPTVLRASEGTGLDVEAIIGPGFSVRQEKAIREVASTITNNTTVSETPDDLPYRMFQADIAVSTASSTTYELLALGTPLVAVAVADNQQPIATALRERDGAEIVDESTGPENIHDAILRYVDEPALRRVRRERGRSIVDGRGTIRIANSITNTIQYP